MIFKNQSGGGAQTLKPKEYIKDAMSNLGSMMSVDSQDEYSNDNDNQYQNPMKQFITQKFSNA